MKANELRIGNIINHITGEITVKSDDFEHIEKDPCEYMDVELTEDWLIRFGYDKYGLNSFYIYNGFFVEWDKKTNKWDCYRNPDLDICSIKYVHQLQNLYFALTGDELKIIQK